MKLSELLAATGLSDTAVSADPVITGVCELSPGTAGGLAWCGSEKYREAATRTHAAAVLIPPGLQGQVANGVVVDNPQAVFSRIAAHFAPDDRPPVGIHPSAVIDPSAQLGADLRIGPHVSVGAGAVLEPGVSLGAGAVVGNEVRIGEHARIGARVVIEGRSQIGKRALILPGAVIGSRGFGNYHDGEMWHEIPQLGRVLVGNDVEIGANTTIDCGALGDTVIGDNVRIDNQCQVAHNVVIGPQTALAAQVGIAGSTQIGAGCMLGGQAGVNGHIRITDRVILNGGAVVYQSIEKPGQYGSGVPLLPVGAFRRLVVLLRSLEPRLKKLEKAVRE